MSWLPAPSSPGPVPLRLNASELAPRRPKTSLDQLAVCGGRPQFAEPLHVGRPNVGDKQTILQRIEQVLDSRWLTNGGPFVRQFEQQVAARAGVQHCIATCNGTTALQMAFRALQLAGEVIVPAWTFVATVHALRWLNIQPVFADIDPQTYTLDPEQVRQRITPRTTAILAVHLWGRPCAIEPLTALARRYRLRLIFDACHAFGATYQGQPIGGFGDAEIFSFHATKFVHSGEGGAVVTNNASLAARLRRMQNFGFVGIDQVAEVGINGKMSEFAAAVGLSSLEQMDHFIDRNQQNYRAYERIFAALPGIHLLPVCRSERANYQYVVVSVDSARCGLTRDQLCAVLQAEGVLARRYFFPACHRMPPYQQRDQHALPVTERAARTCFSLPTGTSITPEQIDQIGVILRLAILHAGPLRRRLQAQTAR